MTKEFDPTKPVQTRDGRKAVILATDGNPEDGPYTINAALISADGEWITDMFTPEGYELKYSPGKDGDLINVPEVPSGFRGEVTKFFNAGNSYGSAHYAQMSAKGYPAVAITFKDGVYVSHEFHEALEN